MKIFAIIAAAAFAATGAVAQVPNNPAVTGSIGATTGAAGTNVPGTGTSATARAATNPARSDRARTGAVTETPAGPDTGITAVPPVGGRTATPGTSVNGDGNATTPGTTGVPR